jgi:type VI secretion system protein
MSITLKIISYQRLTPGQREEFKSDQDRFSIGRNPDNNWSLPDPQRFMSGTHCWLENRNGTWFLTDNSTNGVYINNSDQRVARNDSVALNHGDKLRLGDYEMEVEVEESPASFPSASPIGDDLDDIFATPATPGPQETPQGKDLNTPLSQMDSGLLGDAVSIDDLYNLDEEEKSEPPPTLGNMGDGGSPLRQHFPAPEVQRPPQGPPADQIPTAAGGIPENWDEETGLAIAPVTHEAEAPLIPEAPVIPEASVIPEKPAAPAAIPPTPKPKADAPPYRPAATGSGPGGAMAAFAAGAGLDPKQLHVEDEDLFFRDLGELLKTMTEGLMQAISSRSQIKSEFRLEQTMIGPMDNNPFKFSVSAMEAMSRLLDRSESAYRSGSAAAAEAIDDINAHQMAVMAGTEAALKSVLRQFNPTKLESKFEGDSALHKAMPMLKKAKYWEFYKILYEELSAAADDDFQQYFGTIFSDAYEEQLERLKLTRKEPAK